MQKQDSIAWILMMQNDIPALPRTAIEKLKIKNEANKLHAGLNNALKWYLLIKLKTYVKIFSNS